MESKFNLSLREVLTFWELIFLQQDCGNDSARDLHPALTTYLDVMFRDKNISTYYRPWVIRNVLNHKQVANCPNRAGANQVVAFLRECANVLEKALEASLPLMTDEEQNVLDRPADMLKWAVEIIRASTQALRTADKGCHDYYFNEKEMAPRFERALYKGDLCNYQVYKEAKEFLQQFGYEV